VIPSRSGEAPVAVMAFLESAASAARDWVGDGRTAVALLGFGAERLRFFYFAVAVAVTESGGRGEARVTVPAIVPPARHRIANGRAPVLPARGGADVGVFWGLVEGAVPLAVPRGLGEALVIILTLFATSPAGDRLPGLLARCAAGDNRARR